jgi:hypothetical protein
MAAQASPKSAQWIREHRDLMSTERGRAKVIAAHHDAIASEVTPDTDEYFAHVDKFVGGRSQSQSPNARAAQNYVSRGPKVHLTAGQARAATDGVTHVWNYSGVDADGKAFKKGDAIGLREMARRVRAQTEQGLFNKLD